MKQKWEKDLDDWSQEFGNIFGGFLGMFLIFAVIVFFYEGCSWEGYESNDQIVSPEEKEEDDPSFTASDWILFK